ncbi:hypothetical protein CRX72_06450 [Pantoea sp. BRM17]|nr:hypothetical protein CRX72_06450 [Pantoea sp. BRM17]
MLFAMLYEKAGRPAVTLKTSPALAELLREEHSDVFPSEYLNKSCDMPAHIKSSLLGVSLLLPVSRGRLMLGTWQGIWLGEHRIQGGARRIVATLQGE